MNQITWKHVDERCVKRLNEAVGSRERIEEILRDTFAKEGGGEGEKEKAMIGYHFYNFAFAKEHRFDTRKMACYLSICHEMVIRDACSKASIEESVAFFKELLLMHATERPPLSVGIFSANDTELIVREFVENYYRRYSLVRAAFGTSEDEDTPQKGAEQKEDTKEEPQCS